MICAARARRDRRRLALPLAERFCRRKHPRGLAQMRAIRPNSHPRSFIFLEFVLRRTRIGRHPGMLVPAFGYRREASKNQWFGGAQLGASALRRKIALARLENGKRHETAAITPPP
jgi:hypothetical protein